MERGETTRDLVTESVPEIIELNNRCRLGKVAHGKIPSPKIHQLYTEIQQIIN